MLIELETGFADCDRRQAFFDAFDDFLGRQRRVIFVGQQNSRFSTTLVVVTVDRADIEFFLSGEQEFLDRIDSRLHALQRMLAFDVIRHKQAPPRLLRKGIKLYQVEHQGHHANDADENDAPEGLPGTHQNPLQATHVSFCQAAHQRFGFRLGRWSYARSEHRHECLRDQQRRDQCNDDGNSYVSHEN